MDTVLCTGIFCTHAADQRDLLSWHVTLQSAQPIINQGHAVPCRVCTIYPLTADLLYELTDLEYDIFVKILCYVMPWVAVLGVLFTAEPNGGPGAWPCTPVCLSLQTCTVSTPLRAAQRTTCGPQEVPMQSCIWQHLSLFFFFPSPCRP